MKKEVGDGALGFGKSLIILCVLVAASKPICHVHGCVEFPKQWIFAQKILSKRNSRNGLITLLNLLLQLGKNRIFTNLLHLLPLHLLSRLLSRSNVIPNINHGILARKLLNPECPHRQSLPTATVYSFGHISSVLIAKPSMMAYSTDL